ncbi:hypothetical protein CEXT_430131 [Caerostris extrusa]|uniref:Uncharacterized protein n=1 Tax=Caerostris extrusa TaxID=172846 RepID=A0AAV4U5C9_CAEEX|nr:hypothetical protein CEXT_430131 [Caerostris extrusa]
MECLLFPLLEAKKTSALISGGMMPAKNFTNYFATSTFSMLSSLCCPERIPCIISIQPKGFLYSFPWRGSAGAKEGLWAWREESPPMRERERVEIRKSQMMQQGGFRGGIVLRGRRSGKTQVRPQDATRPKGLSHQGGRQGAKERSVSHLKYPLFGLFFCISSRLKAAKHGLLTWMSMHLLLGIS